MKAYSSLDLLGQKLSTRNSEVPSLKESIKSFIFPESRYACVAIKVPTLTYLRTETYCEILSDIMDDTFESKHFLSVIYKDFIYKFFRYHQHKKTHELIQNYQYIHSPLLINDYQAGKEYVIHDERSFKKECVHLRLKKHMALKGELLLAEIDEMFGTSINLEKLIEIVWMDYVEGSMKMSEKKMITEFLKMINEEHE